MKQNVILLLATFALVSISMPYAKGQDKEQIIKKIAVANAEYKTIISPFTQEKKMKGVKREMIKKGTLYFNRATDELNMQYSQPQGEQLLISNDKLVLIDKSARSTYSTRTDAMMKRLKWTLIYCIGGEIKKAAEINSATVNTIPGADYHTFELSVGQQVKGGWVKIELSYSKKDYTLCLMKLIEKNGNYTIYKTPTKELNVELAAGIFNN